MPMIDFGEELPKPASKFVSLKNVGDKLQFRILGRAFVEGNHFFRKDNAWDVKPCPRVNDGVTCDYCDTLTKAIKEIPRVESKEEWKEKVQEVKKGLRGYEASLTYNFPIINRATSSFAVFAATPGVRNKIEAEAALIGSKVLDVDFVGLKTQNPGRDRYAVTRLDSADTHPLNEEERAVKANFDSKEFERSMNGTADEARVSEEVNSSVEVEEDPADKF